MTKDITTPIHFPGGLTYECTCCGACCSQGWDISIGEEEYHRLKDSDLCREVSKETGVKEIITYDKDLGCAFITSIKGRCAMLDENNKCRIHLQDGYHAKPYLCRQTPLVLVATPDGIYVGVTFVCPSIWGGTGKFLEAYEDSIREMLGDFRQINRVGESIDFSPEVKIDWQGYKFIEKTVLDALEVKGALPDKLWNAMIPVVVMDVQLSREGVARLSTDELKERFEEAKKIEIEKDQLFRMHELNMSYGILSLLESTADYVTRMNTVSLLSGGRVLCRSFNRVVHVEKLQKYAARNPTPWKDGFFFKYVRHLLWRKFLVRHQPMTDALVVLNVLYPIFRWYFYASGYLRNLDCPDEADARFAVSRVELLVHHHSVYNIIKPFARLQADSMKKMTEIVMDSPSEDIG